MHTSPMRTPGITALTIMPVNSVTRPFTRTGADFCTRLMWAVRSINFFEVSLIILTLGLLLIWKHLIKIGQEFIEIVTLTQVLGQFAHLLADIGIGERSRG